MRKRERERDLIYVIPFTRKWFEKLSEAEVCNTLSLYSGVPSLNERERTY